MDNLSILTVSLTIAALLLFIGLIITNKHENFGVFPSENVDNLAFMKRYDPELNPQLKSDCVPNDASAIPGRTNTVDHESYWEEMRRAGIGSDDDYKEHLSVANILKKTDEDITQIDTSIGNQTRTEHYF